jgi:hypothetical protein
MPKEFGARPPYQEPRSQRNTRQEAEHAANDRLPSLMQDEEAWSDRTHEEMVDIIKSSMEQYRLDRDPESQWFDPADWMRDQLCFAMAKNSVEVDVMDDPHVKLLLAWEIISLPHLRSKWKRDHVERNIRNKARILGRTITLDPNESKLLDVMADACGLPQRGEDKHK